MASRRKHKSSLGPTNKVLSQPRRNIVGCRIQHVWKEGGGHVVWKGTVLDQVMKDRLGERVNYRTACVAI